MITPCTVGSLLIVLFFQASIPGSTGDNVECYCGKNNQRQIRPQPQPQKPQPQPQPPPQQQPQPQPKQNQNQQEQYPPETQPKQQPAPNNNTKNEMCSYCILKECDPAGCTAAANFNAADDATSLQIAVKGLGTDENVLINILTKRSDEQIELIRQEYFRSGRTLRGDIEGDTSFKMKELLLALVTPRAQFFAEELKRAFDKEDSDTMMEIFTSLSPCAIRQVASAYEVAFKKQLPKSIKSNTRIGFQKLILELAKGNREPDADFVNEDAAVRDATVLKKAGIEKWLNMDDATFIEIFSKRSYSHLREVIKRYDEMSDSHSIEKDIEAKSSFFEKKLKLGLLALVKNVRNQPVYFADELEDSLKTLILPGPKDNRKFIRIMRGRCGIDLGTIRDAYPATQGGKTLQKRISDKTYMDYTRALHSMLAIN